MINKIEFENNPMIILLPEGAGYMKDDYSKETFRRIQIDFEIYKEQEVFTVLVDDLLYIGADGKLIDDEDKKGVVLQEYSSVFARAMMVAAMICEGKIKISDEINKIEDQIKVLTCTMFQIILVPIWLERAIYVLVVDLVFYVKMKQLF